MTIRKCKRLNTAGAVVGSIALLAIVAGTPAYAELMIQNVTIIDPVAGTTPGQDILIGSNTIAAIGAHGSIATFAPVDTIDATGKFAIPALWDAHVHLTFDPEIGDAALPLFVANGITRVRDTGGLLDKMLAVKERSKTLGTSSPDIYFSGPLVDGIPRVYDGSPTTYPEISSGVLTPEDARAEIDRLADAGAHFIKSYEMLRPETFQALVNRAKERGLPVTSHVPLSMDASDVARAGVRGMEHLRNLGLSCSSKADTLLSERQAMLNEGMNEEGSALRAAIHAAQRPVAFASLSEERCNALIHTLAAQRVFQTPTLALNTRGAFRHFAAKEWQDTFAYLPDAARSRWGAMADRASAMGKDPAQIAFSDWSLSMTGKINTAGVPIMAGTDTPIGLLTPGFSLHLELERLVTAGLTPLEALRAATLTPAAFFGLEDKMGTIEVGKSSDIVLLTANPLEDIRNTQTIDMVILRGHPLDREALDTLLKSAARSSPP